MGRIHVLDDHIANQIAAGEVVERPSSVVKELVENSIDAGSTAVDVSLEEGGLQLIRIADNGSGIEPDDCEKAFFRHATSKISSSHDLFQIRSLGFRGEALPSIAAVAKVECVTATHSGGLGTKIVIEGGTVKSVQDAAAAKGTHISIKELFFNTPARLKYMKTIQTELGHVSDYMYRLAMAHPAIAFTLRHNGNLLLQTLGNGDVLQVIAAIYGTSVAKTMFSVQGESIDYDLTGCISRPETTRANRNAISTIVNGRYIRNYALVHAIMNAYHTLLPINRFPLCVIHIRMEPSLIDVNVHPSKLEVRFSKEPELLQFVQEVLKRELRKHVFIPEAAKPGHNKTAIIQEKLDFSYSQARPASVSNNIDGTVNAHSGNSVLRNDAIKAAPSFHSGPDTISSRPTVSGQNAAAQQQGRTQTSMGQKDRRGQSGSSLTASQINELLAGAGQDEAAKPCVPAFPTLFPIGQMHGTYILAQNEDGLFMIDQHAAHERIHYEHYYELFGNPAQASQEMLLPITLEFTPSDADAIKTQLPLFEQVGVYLEHFGGNAFIVRSLPQWMPLGEEKVIVEEMAEWILAEKKSINLAKLREKSAILCSCKASIKANQHLSDAEMEALLVKLGRTSNPYTCPHGRPIVVSFSTYELEKMFKRVM